MTKIQILATGPELLKRGFRSIEPVTEELIREADNEIQILAYVLTPEAIHLLSLLREAAARGVRITMIINSLDTQHQAIRKELQTLLSGFPYTKILNFKRRKGQLHAKLLIADRKRAVVGSANFTWMGMYANYELGLLVEGETAWELATVVDFLSAMLDG